MVPDHVIGVEDGVRTVNISANMGTALQPIDAALQRLGHFRRPASAACSKATTRFSSSWISIAFRFTSITLATAAASSGVSAPDAIEATTEYYMDSFKAAAASFAVEAIATPVHDMSELESVVAAQAHRPNGGLIVMPDSFPIAHRVEITSLAARYRLPAVYRTVSSLNSAACCPTEWT
jgi:hypothetical protein